MDSLPEMIVCFAVFVSDADFLAAFPEEGGKGCEVSCMSTLFLQATRQTPKTSPLFYPKKKCPLTENPL
jgi:hypothetical protein